VVRDGDGGPKVMCVTFSPDDEFVLAAGCVSSSTTTTSSSCCCCCLLLPIHFLVVFVAVVGRVRSCDGGGADATTPLDSGACRLAASR